MVVTHAGAITSAREGASIEARRLDKAQRHLVVFLS